MNNKVENNWINIHKFGIIESEIEQMEEEAAS